jgi:ABC-type branched-subunit amino acid transport system substrate-binding protein
MTARRGCRGTASLALAGGLLLAGCGTTVSDTSGRAADGALGGSAAQELASTDAAGVPVSGSVPAGQSGAGDSLGKTVAGGAGGTTGGGTQSGAGTSVGTSGGSRTADGSRPVAAGTGEVAIGVETVDAGGGAAAAGAIGVKGISAGDEQGAYKILFDEINKQGGLAGHKIRPVFATYDPAGSDPATQEQSMCEKFTRDNRVVAALLVPTASETARHCLTSKGIPTISRGLGAMVDDKVFAGTPLFATSGTLSLDRMAAVYVDGLHAQGYFGPKPTIGLITAEEASFTRVSDGALRRALKRHGLKVEVEQRVPTAFTVSSYGNAAPAVQSAVLQFQSRGVTHVLFLQPTGASALLFMTAADNQGFHPRYGMSTNDQLQNIAGQVGASQLGGAVAVGWYPSADVPQSTFQRSAPAKKCLALLAAHGNRPGEQSAESGILGVCDSVSVLAGAVRAGGLGGRATIAGVERLGRSVATAAYLELGYSPGHRDGVSLVAGAAYDTTCSCFKYNARRFTP